MSGGPVAISQIAEDRFTLEQFRSTSLAHKRIHPAHVENMRQPEEDTHGERQTRRMKQEYWLESWEQERTGFHQDRTNKRLAEFWPGLGLEQGAEVFVPLAGKSLDLLWLQQQGYRVFGVELSLTAVEAFFAENHVEHVRIDVEHGVEFRGGGAAEGLRVLVADFFALTPADLLGVAGFYDRASLIAMNDDMRADYTRHLAALMPPGAVGLLLTIEYDAARMKGPPFSVPDALARELLGEAFQMDELERYSGAKRLGNLKDRGLDTLTEYVYRLTRLPCMVQP